MDLAMEGFSATQRTRMKNSGVLVMNVRLDKTSKWPVDGGTNEGRATSRRRVLEYVT
jgi:hypothetical protein